MKTKRYLHFVMVAVSVLAMSLFTGCKEKNQPTDPTDPTTPTKDTKAVAATMQIKATFGADMIEMCDISFDYYNEKGEKKNEVVTSTEWTKDIKTAGLPATLGLKWNLAAKADLDESKYEHFNLEYRIEFSSVAVNAAGEKVSTPISGQPNGMSGFAIAKREAAVASMMANNPVKFVIKYDKDGKATEGEWE